MTPRINKFVLTAHITTSVGWLGAVAGFLVLSIAGVTSRDPEVVRGAYVSMNLIGLYIIVPLSLAALLSGLVQSLGTHWGLFRHYWVVMKLLLTTGATALLLVHQFGLVAKVARAVSEAAPGVLPEAGEGATQLVSEAGLGLLALLTITILSVYKPWGRTPYGQRILEDRHQGSAVVSSNSDALVLRDPINATVSRGIPLSLKIFIAITALLVLMFGAMHHGGHGLHHLH